MDRPGFRDHLVAAGWLGRWALAAVFLCAAGLMLHPLFAPGGRPFGPSGPVSRPLLSSPALMPAGSPFRSPEQYRPGLGPTRSPGPVRLRWRAESLLVEPPERFERQGRR